MATMTSSRLRFCAGGSLVALASAGVAGIAVGTVPGMALLLTVMGTAVLAIFLMGLPLASATLVLATPIALGGEGITPIKLAWFSVLLAVGLWSLTLDPSTPMLRDNVSFRRLQLVATAVIAVVLLGNVNGRIGGASTRGLAQASSSFIVLGSAPSIAIFVAHRSTSTQLRRLLVLAGIISSVGVTIYWMAGRGVIPISRIPLYPAQAISSLLLFFSIASFRCTRRWFWALLIAGSLLSTALTGNRNVLVILLIISVPALLIPSPNQPTGSTRSHFAHLFGLVAVLAGTGLAISRLHFLEWRILTQRYSGISDFLTGNTSISDDPSGNLRLFSTRYAFEMFLKDPVLGQGPGVFEVGFNDWLQSHATSPMRPRYTIGDTPLAFLPQYGLLGTITTALFLFLALRFVLRLASGDPVLTLTTKLWIVYVILNLPLMVIVADKSAGMAVGLLLGLALQRYSPVADCSRNPVTAAHAQSASGLRSPDTQVGG